MVSRLGDSVAVPRGLLRELHEELIGVEEVLATLEELMDKQGLKRIRKTEAEYDTGQYTIRQREYPESSTGPGSPDSEA